MTQPTNINTVQQNLITFQKETPIVLEVEITPKNMFHEYLMRLNILKRKQRIEINTLVIGTVSVLCRLLKETNVDITNPEQVLKNGLEMVETNKTALCRFISIAVKNHSGKYSKSCEKMINNQFSISDLAQTVLIVINQMHLAALLQTYCFIKGKNINQLISTEKTN